MWRNEAKRFWKLYTEFKLWTATPDSTSRRFTIEKDSFEDSSLLESKYQTATSMQIQCAIIIGLIYPSSNPFKKHALRVEMHIPLNFPHSPPTIYMLSKIHHVNIDKDGRICSARLDKTKIWDNLTLAEVVKLITGLMDNPETSHVADAEMACLYDSDRESYNRIIKEMVLKDGIPRS